jgi:glutamate/tyrosine decarboxylase-like PLP-dependent enzyme
LDQDALRKQIAELRSRSAPLEWSGETFRQQCESALGPLAAFVEMAAGGPAFPEQSANPLSSQISSHLDPENPIHRLIASQLQLGTEHGSGGFLGFIPCGGLPAAALADLVTSVTNRYASFTHAAPGAAAAECEVIEWLCRLFGLGPDAWGVLTSGGTMATLNCLLAARESVDHVPVEKLAIYMTDQAHHCAARTLKTMGLHRSVRRIVGTDALYRMDVPELRRLVQEDVRLGMHPFLVVASAGTTNTGAIDPLDEIARVAREHKLWFHVDAAYGGFFMLCEEARPAFRGIEHADSIVVDPHKGLSMPMGTGVSLVRDGELLRKAVQEDADYLPHTQGAPPRLQRSPGDYSFELTRHNRAPRIRLSLDIFGEETFAAALSEKLLLANYLYRELNQVPGLTVLRDPQLTVVAFRRDTEPQTQQLWQSILRDGQIFVSPTRTRGEFWIRTCVLSFRTHIEHMEALVERVRAF